ncbi:ubiquitin carboxyl-terminal hydrolase 2-like [Actinidia eriantha]|uniref:ubiquitin carboxyl-terminal hydrolase 2-like n=1 Tax=Actinidia eriantha TaxID=165200 RepID=UPI0025851F6C|nr:ubiquitin carboxyl-terminal hydrolase 2-like [Actinidia eriantha]
MGKKVKKKARSGYKDKPVSTPSQRTVAQESTPSTETVDDGLSVMKERKVCSHLDKGIDLDKVSSRIGLIEHIRCEDCREGAVDRRASKGRGKQGKRKGGGSVDTKSESKAIWICLECGHLSCGGVGFPTTPQSHAVRHARQTRHPLAIQFEHLQLLWCFPCDTLIPVERLEEDDEQKDLLADLVKLIKGRSSQGASVNVEDARFGNGSVASETKSVNTAASILDAKSGYVAKGLVNLGNTCFFNSIMQNLLAMDRLRDHFLELNESVGPLTVSLKKLFVETSSASGLKNVINPRSFFGCVCAKAPQFRGYLQHDSHELLRCLLDGLCTEELSARKRTTREIGISINLGPTFVDAAFGGQLSSTVSCLECGHSSTVFEPFLDLSLPVPTKKPPSKRAQPISRAKKPKLPPKRSGRVRPKVNKDADSVASKSVPVPSASGASCHVESSVLVSEKVGDGLADSKLVECIGPSTVVDKKSSVLSNLLTAEEFTKEPSLEYVMDKTEYSFDNSTWLDYLEPVFLSNDHDMASKTNDIAVENESGQKEVVQDEVSLQDGTESSRQVHSLCRVKTEGSLGNSMWLDYLEPGSLSDNRDMGSKDDNLSVFQDSGRKDDVQNDIFLQNELPQKEETSTSGENLREGEMSSSAVGYEPDGLDFDGLGDLFNEPEIADIPNVKPSSSDTNIQANEIAETGFLVGNSSESDPDEVDNSDSPVSIESCLAFFIKSELLSNEHGWHCENCSKALQEQRMQSRRQQRATSKIQTSEVQDRIQSAPSSSTKDCPCPGELGCLNNGDSRKHVVSTFDESLVSHNEKIDASQNYSNETSQKAELKQGNGEMNEALEELSQTSSCYKTCTQASISGEASDSCSVNEPSNAGCDTDEVQQRKPKLLPKGSELEGSDNVKLNSDSMKVKRDATKRILINRVPPILTIHLKRFSQDARGRLSKLNGHVDFRDTIDLRPYIDPRCTGTDEYKFRLTGVVEHLGTMRGGHYVAYVRGTKGSRKAEQENGDFVWYHVSDAYVREASLEEVHRCEAYILFYEKL